MTSDSGAGQKPVIDGQTPSGAGADAVPPSPPPAADWTASDKRGPLETAEERAAAAGQVSPDAVTVASGDATPPNESHAAPNSSASQEPIVSKDPIAPPDPQQESVTHHDPASHQDPVSHQESPSVPTEPAPAEAPAAATPQPVPLRRRSVWPLAAALVVGAGIGAGSAILMQTPFGATLLGQPTSGAPAVADLSNRVDALEKRPDPSAVVSGLRGALADLDSKVAALQKTSTEPKAPAAAVDLKPFDQKIAALETELANLKSQASAAQGDRSGIDAQLSALKKEVDEARDASAAAKSGVAGLKDEQKNLAAATVAPALAVVADSLVRQIHEGAPYAAQVDALNSLGADPARVGVLREHAATGVAPAKSLATKFSGLATPLAALAHKAPPNAGFVDKLKAGMFNLVTVRRVGESNDSDLTSRVSRIEADLAHDDVVGAYGTWSALPDDAKTKSAEFGAQIKASAEALLAARALQHDAIVGLGRKP